MEFRRTYSPMEIKRAEIKDNIGIIEGHCIKFNSPAPYGKTGFYEMVDPNSLDETLNNDTDKCCFYNHNPDIVLGRESNNTLTLQKDDTGLFFRCEINLNDSDAKNAFERIKRGDVKGCSFGAFIEEEDPVEINGDTVFVLKKLDLIEVSPCSRPFYDDTTVSTRQKILDEKAELDKKWRLFRNGIKKAKS